MKSECGGFRGAPPTSSTVSEATQGLQQLDQNKGQDWGGSPTAGAEEQSVYTALL